MRRTLLAKESCILLMLASVNAYSLNQLNNGLNQEASYTSTIQVDKGIQATNVEAALFVVTKNLAADKKFIAEVLVLREPKTGLSWWRYTEMSEVKSDADSIAKFLSNKKIYLSDDAIGSVTLSDTSLWFRESSEKYPSMVEAESQALKAFADFVPDILKGRGYTLSYEAEVGGHIPLEFFYGNLFSASNKNFAKLSSVRKQGTGWVVSMSGAEDAKIDVEISGQYKVIKTTLYPGHKVKN